MKKYKDSVYMIGENGEVFNTARNKYLTPHKTKRGYYRITLGRGIGRFMLHRLVAELYIPNPNNYPFINHLDGNSLNNSVDNLEWCNQARNVKHAYDIGLRESIKGEDHFKVKLREIDIPIIRKLYHEKGKNYAQIARMYEVSNSTIWHIINNKTWRHINE